MLSEVFTEQRKGQEEFRQVSGGRFESFLKKCRLTESEASILMGYSDSTKAQDRNSQGTKAQNRNIQSILTVKKKQLFVRRSFVTVWRSSPSLPNITVNVHLVAVKRCVGIVWTMR